MEERISNKQIVDAIDVLVICRVREYLSRHCDDQGYEKYWEKSADEAKQLIVRIFDLLEEENT